MKENTLRIRINKPAHQVFRFTLNTQNTPLWVRSITKEETGGWPIHKGSVYRSRNKNGQWVEYMVTEFEENNMFVFAKKDTDYHA